MSTRTYACMQDSSASTSHFGLNLELQRQIFGLILDVMSEERDKVRCQKCELVQWSGREQCRRCGASLPEPIVKFVERVIERIVFQPSSANNAEVVTVPTLSETDAESDFPTMAEMERSMILAAYQRSNRRPLLAARLLGIGKTTMYRKLRAMSRPT